MDKKVVETIKALCDWIQNELENASSVQTESILPAVIEATAKLIDTNRIQRLERKKYEITKESIYLWN